MQKTITLTLFLLWLLFSISSALASNPNQATTPASAIQKADFTILTNSSAADQMTRLEYINTYRSIAITEMNAYKIPASITMAQGILESGNGNSRLATEARNHFGIKCHGWKGESIRVTDDAPDECFRKYPYVMDSYRDHSIFLNTYSRYASLFKLNIKDYKGWAHGLKKAGYATLPEYAELLISLIERHQLYTLDDSYQSTTPPTTNPTPPPTPPVGGKPKIVRHDPNKPTTPIPTPTPNPPVVVSPTPPTNTTSPTYPSYPNQPTQPTQPTQPVVTNPQQPTKPITGRPTVAPTRSLKYNGMDALVFGEEITAREIITNYPNISWTKFKKYNDLYGPTQPIPANTKVYLRKKKNKAPKTNPNYRVKEGDSMWSISQMFGVKLKKLYKKNRMSGGQQPAVGEVLSLRSKRPFKPRLRAR